VAKHIVKVWDEQFEITVVQKSKSVWIAVGTYMGKAVEVQGRSESSAVAHWREAARYRGN
jgi:hypothetical protein